MSVICSEVFRDAAGLGRNSEPKVVMVDTEIENAGTVRRFLELICHGGFDKPLPKDCFGLVQLAMFLDRWSCPQQQSAFWNILELGVRRNTVSASWAFRVAARGDKSALCKLCLEVYLTTQWAVPGSDTALAIGEQGERVWKSNYWPKMSSTPCPHRISSACLGLMGVL